MSYYKLLGFEREPFSTSPDPDFLYMSREYDLALTNILIELRLRRGLSVILGDIGTGKTTLSRKLVQEMSRRKDFIFHVILDPSFDNEKEFLFSVVKNLQLSLTQDATSYSVPELRDVFEKFLLKKNLSDSSTVILIIDEAQKLSKETLEALRVLLNYETNEFKLLQLILLGQLELYSKIIDIPNFYDRIDFKFTLNPFGLAETKGMINFRVRTAGYRGIQQLFSDDAVEEIYYYSKGYPRGITRVCHKCLRSLVMSKTKTSVDKKMVSDVISRDSDAKWQAEGFVPKGKY